MQHSIGTQYPDSICGWSLCKIKWIHSNMFEVLLHTCRYCLLAIRLSLKCPDLLLVSAILLSPAMNGVNWSDSPLHLAQWSCHLYIVLGDKSIPNDSNYQIRKAIMTKIRARGPESQEAEFSWPPVIVISQSSIINHGTGGSKYWERQEAHIFCRTPTQWLYSRLWKQPSSILLIILRHHFSHWATLCSLLAPSWSIYPRSITDSLSWSGLKSICGVLCSWCASHLPVAMVDAFDHK